MPLPPLPADLLSPCMQAFIDQAVVDTLRPIAQRLQVYNEGVDAFQAQIDAIQNEYNDVLAKIDFYTGLIFCLTKTITTIGIYLGTTPCAELSYLNDMLKDQRAEAQALLDKYVAESLRWELRLAWAQQMIGRAQALVNSTANLDGTLKDLVTTTNATGSIECGG